MATKPPTSNAFYSVQELMCTRLIVGCFVIHVGCKWHCSLLSCLWRLLLDRSWVIKKMQFGNVKLAPSPRKEAVEEILHQLSGVSHYLFGVWTCFNRPPSFWWCRISQPPENDHRIWTSKSQLATPAGQAELTNSNKPKSLLRLRLDNDEVSEQMEHQWKMWLIYG